LPTPPAARPVVRLRFSAAPLLRYALGKYPVSPELRELAKG